MKPLKGLTPKYIWEEQRLFDIKCAISRYMNSEQEIPIEWVDEYNEHIKRTRL